MGKIFLLKLEHILNSLLKKALMAVLACLIIQMSGCASSSLIDIWHDSSFKAAPISKMLVIAVRKDTTHRRIWEDAFASELGKHGVAATPSYRLFPDSLPDTTQVISTVQANGFEGILVTLRLPMETNKLYIRGYTSVEQDVRFSPYYGPYYSPYWERYRTYYREVEHPGYVDSQKVAVRAIDVTTTGKNGHLIWSATSRTPDPGSVTDVQEGIAGLVITDLARQKIISPKNQE
jgi:hypothetical protein